MAIQKNRIDDSVVILKAIKTSATINITNISQANACATKPERNARARRPKGRDERMLKSIAERASAPSSSSARAESKGSP